MNENQVNDCEIWDFFYDNRKNLCMESGGKDEILCEFDGLLASILSNETLDTKVIPQFLHVVYMLENFLDMMKKRDLHVRVVFFKCFERIWKDESIRFLRMMLLFHLQSIMKNSVNVFLAPNEDFEKFIQEKQPWLCFGNHENKSSVPFVENWTLQDVYMAILTRQLNMIDFVTYDSLVFHSNSISGFVWKKVEDRIGEFEGYVSSLEEEAKKKLFFELLPRKEIQDPSKGIDVSVLKEKYPLLMSNGFKNLFYVRSCLAIELCDEDTWKMIQLFLYTIKIQNRLSLEQRCLNIGPMMNPDIQQKMKKFINQVSYFMEYLYLFDTFLDEDGREVKPDLIDFVDVRLFYLIYQLYEHGLFVPDKDQVLYRSFFLEYYRKKELVKPLPVIEKKGEFKVPEITQEPFEGLFPIQHIIVDEIMPQFKSKERKESSVDRFKKERSPTSPYSSDEFSDDSPFLKDLLADDSDSDVSTGRSPGSERRSERAKMTSIERMFEKKYHWKLRELSADETLSGGNVEGFQRRRLRTQRIKYNEKIQGLQRYADSLRSRDLRKVIVAKTNLPEITEVKEDRKDPEVEVEDGRRGKKKKKKKGKKNKGKKQGPQRKPYHQQQQQEEQTTKEEIVKNNKAKENLQKLKMIEDYQKVLEKNFSIQTINQILTLVLELYIKEELELENLLIFCYYRKIQFYFKRQNQVAAAIKKRKEREEEESESESEEEEEEIQSEEEEEEGEVIEGEEEGEGEGESEEVSSEESEEENEDEGDDDEEEEEEEEEEEKEEDLEKYKWRIFQAVLNMYRVFNKIKEKRIHKEKEEGNKSTDDNNKWSKKKGKKKKKKGGGGKKNKKKKMMMMKKKIETNFVSDLEEKISSMVKFSEESINSTIQQVLKRLELTEEFFIKYQLEHREHFQNIVELKELTDLEDYWNTEDFEKYKKVYGFIPDEWQKRLMNVIDNNESCVVSTPTSSGKTFMTLYLMEKILTESDDGVLVFVAPTISLVNMVAAEVLSMFGKNYKDNSRKVIGVFTNVDKIQPLNCQILVTVAECFEHLLLSPSSLGEAQEWRKRLKYVVFDEIHTINQFEGGEVWERLLLMNSEHVPFLALSATIGNPQEFVDWLNLSKDGKVKLIENRERPNVLKYFVFDPRGEVLSSTSTTENGKERKGKKKKKKKKVKKKYLFEIHPLGLLSEDLGYEQIKNQIEHTKQMSANQCLQLYNLIKRKLDESEEVSIELTDPSDYFETYRKKLIPRNCVREYENLMKEKMLEIAKKYKKMYSEIILELRGSTFTRFVSDESYRNELKSNRKKGMKKKKKDSEDEIQEKINQKYLDQPLVEGLKKLVETLKNERLFPALIFHFSRTYIEQLAFSLTNAMPSGGLFETEGQAALYEEDMEEVYEYLIKNNETKYLKPLKQSIAIHHGAIGKNYRSEIERLFRQKKLKVMIATGTLSLGINMPCKTVVLLGDSIFLTPTLFNQTTGRSGRRGFDIIGNVILYDLPLERTRRLMVRENERILGNMNINVTFVLKLMQLLKNKTFIHDVKRMLETPLSCLGKNVEIAKKQVIHQVRFSLEFLARAGMINGEGRTVNFAGMAEELARAEPSNFLFIYLLEKELFHSIYEKEKLGEFSDDEDSDSEIEDWNIEEEENRELKKQEERDNTMIFLITLLFTKVLRSRRCPISHKLPNFCDGDVNKIPFLREDFQKPAKFILKEIGEYKKMVRDVFSAYIRNFGEMLEDQNKVSRLPLSGLSFENTPSRTTEEEEEEGEEDEGEEKVKSSSSSVIEKLLEPYMMKMCMCSLFSGLSGNCDARFQDLDLLGILSCLRSDFFIDTSILPIPDWLLRDDVFTSTINLDFYHKWNKVERIAEEHPHTKQEVTWHVSSFLKYMGKIISMVQKVGPSADPWLKKMVEIRSKYLEFYYGKSRRRWKRREGNLRTEKYSEEVGDMFFDENGHFNPINVPLNFTTKGKTGEIRLKEKIPHAKADESREKSRNKRGANEMD